MPTRSGPPVVAGRWSLLPPREPDPTLRAHAQAEVLLERHGVVTRGAVVAERAPGGFAATYRVLAAFEDAGRVRRGYFVEGLGASQFGTAGAVDRLRGTARPAGDGPGDSPTRTVVLAAADPANPYGAALPWPERALGSAAGHRAGRKAGRAGRARRRRAGALRRARRPVPAVLDRRPAHPAGRRRRPGARRSARARSAGSRCSGRTAPRCWPPTTHWSRPWPRRASTPRRRDCGSEPEAREGSCPRRRPGHRPPPLGGGTPSTARLTHGSLRSYKGGMTRPGWATGIA